MGKGRKKALNEEMVVYMKNQGATHQEIADYFGVDISTVTRTLSKYKGQYDASKNLGRNNRLDLPAQEIEKILTLKQMGYSLQTIANMTGYTKSKVYRVIKENGGNQ